MGPAILLCPSSSALYQWGQVSHLKETRQKEGSFFLSHGYPRCSANAHWSRVFQKRHVFFFNPAFSSEKCRKPIYPFAWRRVSAAVVGGEVSLDEATVALDTAPTEVGTSSEPALSTEEAPTMIGRKTQTQRMLNRSNRNANKAVVVSPAELIPGAVFPGKVTSIQTFGAFVDLGAFTNGLVHISRVSKSYVKKVEDVVQVGQDVKVQILEVDNQAKRISLMLVEEGKEEVPQEGEAGEVQPQRSSQQQARRRRKQSPSQRQQAVMTTMKKGEICTGTVKSIIKSGVFVTLPDGTDGYLQGGEVVFKGPNMNMEAQFQVGQELTVRVLRIEKGRVSLTMKREVNFDKLNEDLNKGVVDGATNPFEIAFRRNELIANFLLDRDKQKLQVEEAKTEEAVNSVDEEVKDAVPFVRLASEEEEEDKQASSTGAMKVEVITAEVSDSREEVKDVAEVEKPIVVEDEERVVIGVNATKDEALQSEVIDSVEEGKDVAKQEMPVVKEEEEKMANFVKTMNKEGAVSEAANSVAEEKNAAEEEKSAVKEEEEKVAIVEDTTEEESVVSDAVNPIEKVKDVAKEGKAVILEAQENVMNGVDTTKDEAVISEAVNFVEEEVKDAAQPLVEEVVVPEAVNSVEEVKDTVEEEKPVTSEGVDSVAGMRDAAEVDKPGVEEGREKEKVANGLDAIKVVSSQAGVENIVTVV